jgi:hypothetical protein
MTDITDRLRAALLGWPFGLHRVLYDAIHEIERLRKERDAAKGGDA